MSEIGLDAQLTALILRDVAAHLERGHVMSAAGEWTERRSVRMLRRGNRTAYLAGRVDAEWDAIRALRWIADRNDPPEASQ